MSTDIIARGPGVEPAILAAGRAALAERFARYGSSVRGASLFAEDLGTGGERGKQMTLAVDFDRGGRLVLNFSRGSWDEVLKSLPQVADESINRELQRRWELTSA
ncbi:MAG TPA: hypothetical protein VK465_09195 [Fibrobacteria bacterium]|nr:hypothetical protein [Fibrobacteria bacterium]